MMNGNSTVIIVMGLIYTVAAFVCFVIWLVGSIMEVLVK